MEQREAITLEKEERGRERKRMTKRERKRRREIFRAFIRGEITLILS